MQITDVDIAQYRYCPSQARHLATVRMIMQDRIVTMFCRLDLPRDTPARSRTEAFLRDAARQLARMPEFRPTPATLAAVARAA